MEILNIENLSFKYPLCTHSSIKNISFTVEKGSFVTVCGATGSGKSTLLRLLKREIRPNGDISGSVYFNGCRVEALSGETSAREIGYVMQRPEQQIVTDKVWHELAFGLENLNLPQSVIARRIAEMAAYFGIEDWFDKSVSQLSGGQKQLLNLASVMVMQPSVIILDEPTAQLDPIAASDFIATVKKLNRDLSVTVIIAEHRLEEVIPACDRLLVIDDGRLIDFDCPRLVISRLANNPRLICAMPAAARLYHQTRSRGECPLDVREGRKFIETNFKNNVASLTSKPYKHSDRIALEFDEVYFRYEKNTPDVLRGLSLKIYENEIFCLLGGNGSGKTTTLLSSAGLIKPYSGKIKVFGKKINDYKNQTLYRGCLSMLPQDVQTVFLKNTVRDELCDAFTNEGDLPFDLSHLYEKHPYDLSGGEQQMLAMAKVLATNPKLLLLDEPTKGLDANAKLNLIDLIKTLKARGMTVVIVTHDVEFAALCADRAAMFFRGEVVSDGAPSEFFAENSFYTTAANRMSRGYYKNAVTVDDLALLCTQNGRKDGAV